MISESIWINIIGSISLMITAIITGYFALKSKRIEKELEANKEKHSEEKKVLVKENTRLKVELKAINILFTHDMISFINDKVDYLFNNTKAERFIMLFAINGKDAFNFVSVCYEKTKTEKTRGAIYRYVKLEIDDDYKLMLKKVEKESQIYLDVSKMNECLLKDIYTSLVENVTFAGIKFIKRIHADSDNDIIIYSSLATTDKSDFSHYEKTHIKMIYNQIRDRSQNLTFTQN